MQQEVHGTILPVLKVEHAAHDVVSSADARLLAHLNEPERSDGGGCCPRGYFHVAWREEKDPTGFEGVVGTELGVRIFLPLYSCTIPPPTNTMTSERLRRNIFVLHFGRKSIVRFPYVLLTRRKFIRTVKHTCIKIYHAT